MQGRQECTTKQRSKEGAGQGSSVHGAFGSAVLVLELEDALPFLVLLLGTVIFCNPQRLGKTMQPKLTSIPGNPPASAS